MPSRRELESWRTWKSSGLMGAMVTGCDVARPEEGSGKGFSARMRSGWFCVSLGGNCAGPCSAEGVVLVGGHSKGVAGAARGGCRAVDRGVAGTRVVRGLTG